MLRVTKLADYGIIMMAHLAKRPGETFNARDIARTTRLPQPVVSKILKRLAREGLLSSQRGIKGGYGLALRPERITVASIIRALEGPIAVTECSDQSGGDCGLQALCPVQGNWNLINQAIQGALDKITLSEMAQPMPRLVSIGLPAEPRVARPS